MIIDAHHHFWKYDPEEYSWISPSMARLRRDFLPDDLKRETSGAVVDGVVSVQARQTVVETEWLLTLAEQCDWILGVVGWVPLIADDLDKVLESFASRPKLKALRHVLQDESDKYMLQPEFDRGITRLHHFDLRYDILIYERQLPAAIQLVDRHPEQIFILDHIAKPRIREQHLSPWQENLRELARRENVYCKLSGMVTEADHEQWTVEQLQPYADTALDAFGPGRLMFGSDWPVILLASDYRRWKDLVAQFASKLSSGDAAQVMGETAIRAYGL